MILIKKSTHSKTANFNYSYYRVFPLDFQALSWYNSAQIKNSERENSGLCATQKGLHWMKVNLVSATCSPGSSGEEMRQRYPALSGTKCV